MNLQNQMYINKFIVSLLLCTFTLLFFVESIKGQQPNYTINQPTFKERFMQFSKYCTNGRNVSIVEFVTMFTQNNDSGSPDGKCYLSCMLQKYQVMDQRNVYHKDKLNQLLNSMPDSKFTSSLKSNKDKCLKEVENNQKNPCQMAYTFFKCFYQSAMAKKSN